MNGYVVAFDTATESCAIGVGIREKCDVTLVASHDFAAPRAAMSGLLPAVSALLAKTGVSLDDVMQVVVGRGPGSFTGVRIGVATAKGFAHGLGVPLFGVGTLDAIAWGIPSGYEGTLGVLGDAMRGEVYPALFDVAEGADGRVVRRRAPDHVAKPDVAAAEWARLGERMLLAGNGLAKYADTFVATLGAAATLAAAESWAPTGVGLLRAFEASCRGGALVGGAPGVVLPVYTRVSDAEEAERARAGIAPAAPPATGVDGPSADASRSSSGPTS